MSRWPINRWLVPCVVVALLGLFLASDYITSAGAPHWLQVAGREVAAVCRDAEAQWMITACLGIYLAFFLLWEQRLSPSVRWWRWENKSLWLAIFVGWVWARYFFAYASAARSLQIPVLLAGMTLGRGLGIWMCWPGNRDETARRVRWLLGALVVLLVSAAWCHPEMRMPFQYRGLPRWSGPWNNPNICGLLMGAGATLAMGMALGRWSDQVQRPKSDVQRSLWQWSVITLCVVAAALMARGLLRSYSRGAWLATTCGMGYLLFQAFKCQVSGLLKTESGKREGNLPGSSRGDEAHPLKSASDNPQPATGYVSCVLWLQRHRLALSVILLSVTVLTFWHFRQTDWRPAQRAFSVVNAVDFSWRNRVAAWEGALQITAEQPWFGAGWSQPEPLYEHYHLPPRLDESAAIQMNDHLMLAATLGIPAFFCLGMYLWLSLAGKAEGGRREAGMAETTWLKVVYHAGAIALLVGFWFDGGLFELPTAATFWILLESGSAASDHKGRGTNTND